MPVEYTEAISKLLETGGTIAVWIVVIIQFVSVVKFIIGTLVFMHCIKTLIWAITYGTVSDSIKSKIEIPPWLHSKKKNNI